MVWLSYVKTYCYFCDCRWPAHSTPRRSALGLWSPQRRPPRPRPHPSPPRRHSARSRSPSPRPPLRRPSLAAPSSKQAANAQTACRPPSSATTSSSVPCSSSWRRARFPPPRTPRLTSWRGASPTPPRHPPTPPRRSISCSPTKPTHARPAHRVITFVREARAAIYFFIFRGGVPRRPPLVISLRFFITFCILVRYVDV